MWNKTCECCAFRARRGKSGVPMYTCDYLYYADKMRGCDAGKECTRFVKCTEEIDELVKKASKGRLWNENEGTGILAFLAKDFPNVPTPVTYERPKRREEKDELTEQEKAQIAAELAGEVDINGKAWDDAKMRKTKEKVSREKYYQKNKEKILAKNREWQKAHPEKQKEYMERYLAKKKAERSEKNGVQQEPGTAAQDQDRGAAAG